MVRRGRTMERGKKTEKVLDLLYSVFSKSLLNVKKKLQKDIYNMITNLLRSGKHYIHAQPSE